MAYEPGGTGYHGSRNKLVREDFVRYCVEHPELRFWQALRDWAGYNYILATNQCPVFKNQEDTLKWEGRNG